MATILRIKRSGSTGSATSLKLGELAYSYLTGTQSNGGDRLYVGTGTETAGEAANIDVIGGKYFTNMLDHVTGTLTASSALLVDANSKVDVLNVDNITLKHGCSEFYESYPEFKKINPNSEKQMKYNNEWKSFEEIIDSREPKRIDEDKKIFSKSIECINLSDILIINNWISYAQIIGDESYKKIYDKKIENVFVNKFLEDQLEFRKNELKS